MPWIIVGDSRIDILTLRWMTIDRTNVLYFSTQAYLAKFSRSLQSKIVFVLSYRKANQRDERYLKMIFFDFLTKANSYLSKMYIYQADADDAYNMYDSWFDS